MSFEMAGRKKQDPEDLAMINYIAERLGVKLDDQHEAVATKRKSGRVRMYDGSLEVEVLPTVNGAASVEAPKSPGVWIDLVDHTKDAAPEGAIYRISAYKRTGDGDNCREGLRGHVYHVFVGHEGIILDELSMRDVAKVHTEKYGGLERR
jgi:hypothetical protein